MCLITGLVEINRAWMYDSHDTCKFVDGVFKFCNPASTYRDANGTMDFISIESLREHMFRCGFRLDYHVWVWQGEEEVYDGGNAQC